MNLQVRSAVSAILVSYALATLLHLLVEMPSAAVFKWILTGGNITHTHTHTNILQKYCGNSILTELAADSRVSLESRPARGTQTLRCKQLDRCHHKLL